MEKRTMEQIGAVTSLLGFGCMRLPLLPNGRIDTQEAERMVDEAYKNGVNYFDTAYVYHDGESEEFIGKALSKYPRDSYYLATKLPVWEVNGLADVDRLFEEQRTKLDKDYIDFYLLHALTLDRFRKMKDLGVIEHCEKLKAEGKIKYLGFSFHDNYEAFEEMINYRQWDFCQIQFNYMDTEEQAGIKGYELAKSRNIPLVIMEPVRGGHLSRFSEDIENIFKEANSNASISSFAFRWVSEFSNVKVILSGMSTMEQVKDNLATFAAPNPLSEKEKEAIDKVIKILRDRIQNGCTACAYCMPCPAGVDIPANFDCWNTYHTYQTYGAVKFKWEGEIPESAKGTACIECGKCEEVCPQKLSIRQDLKKVCEDLKNPIWA